VKKTVAVFLRPGPNWDASKGVREQELWDEHAQFVDDLFARGLIMLVGSFAPDGTGALAVLNVESADEARAIYAKDPWALRQILLTSDAREWTIFLDSSERSE
jgi:uncharacterized protein YciI